ncbi:GntR family transcriptional regulator [Nocardia sp. NPDC058176]|uniref:AAA family ATPase n=1 Tax=Nocardia sp. NPDC058176 TaxID=3346368 RepID=UPI0036DF90F0
MTEPEPDRTAIHLRVAQAIRSDIEAGRLRDGQRLPSTRELAQQWKVSNLTIQRAMDLLTEDGYIESRNRSGRIVSTPTDLTLSLATPIRPAHPRIVMVGGFPGSGKTEFARVLARETGWALLDKDTISRPVIEPALVDLGSSLNDRESDMYVQKIRPREYEALAATIADNVEVGNSVVATAPYLREFNDAAWVDNTTARAATLNADVTLVWVRCTPETMKLYLRRRGAARDAWKLEKWDQYLGGLNLDFRPVGDFVVVENDPGSEPLQKQARRLLDSFRWPTTKADQS